MACTDIITIIIAVFYYCSYFVWAFKKKLIDRDKGKADSRAVRALASEPIYLHTF